MNKTHRIVWSASRQAYIVAHEKAAFGGRASTTLSFCAALLLGSGAALAQLPTGGQVVAGSGNIAQSGNTLTVTQESARMAADWQTFSIGQGHTVNFVQPSTSAVALNRVLGTEVSVIQGALNANGQLFLVNPNGVLFTPTAQVNVGAMVASTLNIAPADFMAGRYNFSGSSSNAIINQGNITAQAGGSVALIAARIVNTGSISAQGGQVLMAAGQAVRLNLGGPISIEVQQGALDALIEQGGAIRADGGLVYLTARSANALVRSVINMGGITEARSIGSDALGRVVLSGDASSGRVELSGRIDTSAAAGSGRAGGAVDISAQQVWLQGTAQIDSRGDVGGGQVRVGGGWQGQDAGIANAQEVQVDAGAGVNSSTRTAGQAGQVVFWADEAMRFNGSISARGGDAGGDGAWVEVSGRDRLGFAGTVDTSAPMGNQGLLLLDPNNLTIVNGSAGTTGTRTQWANSADTNNYTIAETTLEGLTGNIILHAHQNITVQNLTDGVLDLSDSGLVIQSATFTTSGNLTINTSANQIYHGAITLGGNLTLRSTNGSVGFRNTINGAHALDVRVGSTGRIVFNQDVGGVTPLASLDVGTAASSSGVAGQTFINANITTSGNQIYRNTVLVGSTGPQFVNGGFETGNVSGWDVFNSRARLGQTVIGGFTSPADTTFPRNPPVLDASITTANPTFTTTVSNATADRSNGTFGLVMRSSFSCDTGYCIIHGPYVVSQSTVSLMPGDAVSFDWSAAGGGDAFDVFGYLLNTATGAHIPLINATGGSATASQPWTTVTRTLAANEAAGDYRFVFVSGSFDFTGGRVLGARLLIDNVRTVTNTGDLFAGTPCTTCTVTGTNIQFAGNVTLDGALNVSNTDTATNSLISGTISGGGALHKTGAGTLVLSGNNSFRGGVNITQGSLNLNSANALGAAGSIQMSGGSVLHHTVSNVADYSARLSTAGNQQFIIDTGSNNVTFAGAIAGANTTLEKRGSGTLTLTANGTYTGATTVTAGTLELRHNAPTTASTSFGGTGNMLIQSVAANFTSAFSTAAWNFGTNLGGLTIGRTGNTSAINLDRATTIAGPLQIHGGAVNVNAAFTTTGMVRINHSASVTDGASGALIAPNLVLRGSGSGAHVLLDSGLTNVGTMAATGLAGLTLFNANTLTVGAVDGVNGISASGMIDLATQSGDLTLAQNVSTTNASLNAVRINAGRAAEPGTASGGNLLRTGSATVTTGSGGRAVLMGGSITGSTAIAGVNGLVSNNQQRFRYNADESTNFASGGWLNLGNSGLFGVFREQPSATLTLGSQTITYGTEPTAATSTWGGLLHGDTLTPTLNTVQHNGAAVVRSGAGFLRHVTSLNAYRVTAPNAGAALGYNVAVTEGRITVDRRQISATFTGQSRTYDGTTHASVSHSFTNFNADLQRDNLTLTRTAAFDNRNAGNGKTINITGITFDGADADNYQWMGGTTATTTANIQRASITLGLAAEQARSKVYDGTTELTLGTGAVAATSGTLFAGDTIVGTASANFDNKHAGTGKRITLSGVTINDGNGGNNYTVSFANITDGSITQRPLTVTAPQVTKVYDGTVFAGVGVDGEITGEAVRFGTGDTVAVLHQLNFDNANVSRDGNGAVQSNKTVTPSGLVIRDASGADTTANYAITWQANNTSTINPAPLTVRANHDARFVLNVAAPGHNFNGVSFVGFVNGETASGVFGPAMPTVTSAGADVTTPPGALESRNLTPNIVAGSANNYAIATVNGTLTIVPSERLIVRMTNAESTFGTAANYTIAIAEYWDTVNNAVATLTNITQGNNNTGFVVSDGAGASVTFNVAPPAPPAGQSNLSTAGHLRVGQYQLAANVTQATGAGNFNNNMVLVGAHQVNRLSLTIGSASPTKVYDGSRAIADAEISNAVSIAGVQSGTVSGNTVSDIVTVAAERAEFDNKNVNRDANGNVLSNKSFTLAGLTLSGADADNYFITNRTLTGTTGRIDPRTLTLTATGVDRVFDGTTTATVTLGDNRVAGDTLTFAQATHNFASRDVARDGSGNVIAQNITLGNISLSGTDALNYTLAALPTNVSARILPRPLNLTATGVTREYDATTIAGVNITDDRITGDVLNFTQGVHNFVSPNVNRDSNGVVIAQNITLGTITLDGTHAGNYTWALPSTVSAVITPRPVTISAAGGISKEYDGTTAMTGINLQITGNLDGSGLTVSGSGAFSSPNAGTGLSYTLSGLALSGAAAGNYILSGGLTTITGNDGVITARPLIVTATGVNRVYDGTTNATVTLTHDGLVLDANNLTINLTSAAFANRNVARNPDGTLAYVPINVLLGALTGFAANNYVLVDTTPSAQAIISPRAIGVSGIVAQGREYDTTTDITLNDQSAWTFTGGFVAGDDVTLSFGTPQLDSPNAGQRTVNLNMIASGDDVGNYNITPPTNLNVTIEPRLVTPTFTGPVTKVYDGSTAMTGVTFGLGGNLDGLDLQLSNQGHFATRNVGQNLNWTINNLQLIGSAAANYTLGDLTHFSGTNGEITPLAVTLSLGPGSRVYDGSRVWTATPANLSALTSQLGIAGDRMHSIVATFDNKNVGTDKAIALTNPVVHDADGNVITGNYNFTLQTDHIHTITRLNSVTWTGAGNDNQWFNPHNWAGGAIPDLANVANVVIPNNVQVNFDEQTRSGLAEAGRVELDNLNGGSLNLAAGSLRTAQDMTVQNLSSAAASTLEVGRLLVVNANANVNLAGQVTSPEARFNAAGHNVTISNSASDIDSLALQAHTASVTDRDELQFLASTLSGNLNTNTGTGGQSGGISQNGAVQVAGSSNFVADTRAAQNAVLNDANNRFGGAVSFSNANNGSWNDAQINSDQAINLAQAQISQDLNVRSGQQIDLGQVTVGRNLYAYSDRGSVFQTALITVGGFADVAAPIGTIPYQFRSADRSSTTNIAGVVSDIQAAATAASAGMGNTFSSISSNIGSAGASISAPLALSNAASISNTGLQMVSVTAGQVDALIPAAASGPAINQPAGADTTTQTTEQESSDVAADDSSPNMILAASRNDISFIPVFVVEGGIRMPAMANEDERNQ